MRCFTETQINTLKAYAVINNEVYNELFNDVIRDEFETYRIKNPNATIEQLESYRDSLVLSPENLLRLYIILKNEGLLQTAFEMVMTREVDGYNPARELMREYFQNQLEESYTIEDALNEYENHFDKSQIWKFFEDENNPRFIIPVNHAA